MPSSLEQRLLGILEFSVEEVIRVYEATGEIVRIPFGDDALPKGCREKTNVVWRIWGSGPVVVLLHGGTGSWLHWIRTIPALADNHTLLVPDIPGMGDSCSPPVTTPVEALILGVADILINTLAQLIPTSTPVHLVGFSFGSMVAAHMAARLGTKVQRLILVGSSGFGLSHQGVKGLQKPRSGMSTTELRALHYHNMCTILFHDAHRADDLALEMQLHNGARMRLRTHESAISSSLADALLMIRSDILAVWGAEDPFIPNDTTACEALLQRSSAPSSHLHFIPDAGHWVAYEGATAFNQWLTKCLD